MKFEDVYGRCYRGDLSQAEASEILGMASELSYNWLRLSLLAHGKIKPMPRREGAPRVCTTAPTLW